MPTENNRDFGLAISVGRGAGKLFSSLCSQNVSGLWLDVEEETTASDN